MMIRIDRSLTTGCDEKLNPVVIFFAPYNNRRRKNNSIRADCNRFGKW